MFINSKLKDKKAAKLIIKRAKKDPKLYTDEEVRFAKMVRKRIKDDKKSKENCKRKCGESKDSIKFIDISYNYVIISTHYHRKND